MTCAVLAASSRPIVLDGEIQPRRRYREPERAEPPDRRCRAPRSRFEGCFAGRDLTREPTEQAEAAPTSLMATVRDFAEPHHGIGTVDGAIQPLPASSSRTQHTALMRMQRLPGSSRAVRECRLAYRAGSLPLLSRMCLCRSNSMKRC
jgi:hypothetical protein